MTSFRFEAFIIAGALAVQRSVDAYIRDREHAAQVRQEAELKIGITDTVEVFARDRERHQRIRRIVGGMTAAVIGAAVALWLWTWLIN